MITRLERSCGRVLGFTLSGKLHDADYHHFGPAVDAAVAAHGKIRMLADPGADFTRAVGMQVEAKALGGTRSKRYSMLIEDGVVKSINLEPDGFGLTCSLAPALIDQL